MITREWLLGRKHSGKYLCPECSHTRKNKHDKCLSVTIKTEGVVYYCHNCNAQGGEFYDKHKYNKLGRKEINKKGSSREVKNRKWTGIVW